MKTQITLSLVVLLAASMAFGQSIVEGQNSAGGSLDFNSPQQSQSVWDSQPSELDNLLNQNYTPRSRETDFDRLMNQPVGNRSTGLSDFENLMNQPVGISDLNRIQSQISNSDTPRIRMFTPEGEIPLDIQPGEHYHVVRYYGATPDQDYIALGRGFVRNGGHTQLGILIGAGDGMVSERSGNVIFDRNGNVDVGGRYLTGDHPTAARDLADDLDGLGFTPRTVTGGRIGEIRPAVAEDTDSSGGTSRPVGTGLRIIGGIVAFVGNTVTVADVVSGIGGSYTQEDLDRLNDRAGEAQRVADSGSDAWSVLNGSRFVANTAIYTAGTASAANTFHNEYQPDRDAADNWIQDNVVDPIMDTDAGHAVAEFFTPLGDGIEYIADRATEVLNTADNWMNEYGARVCAQNGASSCSYSSNNNNDNSDDLPPISFDSDDGFRTPMSIEEAIARRNDLDRNANNGSTSSSSVDPNNGLTDNQITADTVFDWEREANPNFDRNGQTSGNDTSTPIVTDNPIYTGNGWQDDTVFNSRNDVLPEQTPGTGDLANDYNNPDWNPGGDSSEDLNPTPDNAGPSLNDAAAAAAASAAETRAAMDDHEAAQARNAVDQAQRSQDRYNQATTSVNSMRARNDAAMDSVGMGTTFDGGANVSSWSTLTSGGTWTNAGAGVAGSGGQAAAEDFMKQFFMDSIGLDLDRLTVHNVDEGGGGDTEAYFENLLNRYDQNRSDSDPEETGEYRPPSI